MDAVSIAPSRLPSLDESCSSRLGINRILR
jgi:hypothetical protein